MLNSGVENDYTEADFTRFNGFYSMICFLAWRNDEDCDFELASMEIEMVDSRSIAG